MLITTTSRGRRSRRLLAGLAAASLILAACGGDDDAAPADPPATTADATTPETTDGGTGSDDADSGPTGTLVVGLDRDPGYLDPYHAQNHTARSIAQSMFDALVTDLDGEYVPTLAESYEVIDDLTISFTLRDGVEFHNGETFDAATVEYNVARMNDPEVDSHYAAQFAAIESVEVVGDLEVVLHLSEPDANIIDTLTHLFMVPPGYAEEVGPDGFNTAPIGTGPFTFVSYAPDDNIVVTANLSYWEGSPKGMPLVETVEFRAIPEETTRVAELRTGGVDLAFRVSPDQIDAVESGGATAVTYNDLSMHFIQINTAGLGSLAEEASGDDAVGFEALQDPRVRTALNLAIDREAITDAFFGGLASPMGQPFSPGGALTPDIDLAFDYDPDRARELLEEAGYGDGLSLNMLGPAAYSSDAMALTASYFAEIGVEVTIEQIESATFNDGWVAGQFPHLRYAGWSSPTQALALLMGTGALISSYANPEVDELLELQATQLDIDERRATIEELATVMHDDAAWVFLWATQEIVGVNPAVSGWTPAASHVPVTNVSVNR